MFIKTDIFAETRRMSKDQGRGGEGEEKNRQMITLPPLVFQVIDHEKGRERAKCGER